MITIISMIIITITMNVIVIIASIHFGLAMAAWPRGVVLKSRENMRNAMMNIGRAEHGSRS